MLDKVLAFTGLAAIIIASLLLLRLDSAAVDWLVDEDGPIESFGAAFLLVGSIALLLALRHLRPAGGSRPGIVIYLGCALFLLVAAGEEISWAQRQLGIETPEPIREINSQGEINLHNLYGDEDGQNFSLLLFKAFWFGLGVVVPLLAMWRPLGRHLRRHLPVFPVWVALLFVFQQLLWRPVEVLWRLDPGSWRGSYRGEIGGDQFRIDTPAEIADRAHAPAGMDELMETNVELLLMVGPVCVLLAVRRAAVSREHGSAQLSPGRLSSPSAKRETGQ